MLSNFSFSQTPTASFILDQAAGCSPLTVAFTNTSVNASSCYWDFGNGNVSVLPNPSNVYLTPGTYTVKLIAISANGQKDSLILTNLVTVSLNANADFYATNTTSCFAGNSFSFVNTSSNASSCLWDFGDGNTSTIQNPLHTYASQGNFTVKLIAFNSFGCSDVKTRTNYISVIPKIVTSFTVNDSTACNTSQVFSFSSTTPNANAWLWDFGDGAHSNMPNPQHAYVNAGVYTVSLITANANNCTDTLTKINYILITSNQAAAFTSNTIDGCTLSPISFWSISSNNISWSWSFGDSGTSTSPYPSHIYQNSGNYTVSLTITTSNNCTYSASVSNYLSISDNSISSFSINNPTGCAPLNVQFTNLSTNAVSHHWYFGDGYTSSLENPSHVYTANGTYSVSLQTTNSSGCVSVYQLSNAVILAPPNANFSSNYIPGCAPLAASFTNISGNSTQWLWDFGDGTISTLQNPVHAYNLPGDYDVSLIASNGQGCSDTSKLISYIHVVNAGANYTPPPTLTGCVPMSTTFQNNTIGAVAWFWDFGDGTTSTLQNPSHTFISSGFYTVSLTIQLSGGCTQVYSVFRTFDVQGGSAGFTYTQTQCAPYVANFTDTASANWISWFWDFGDGSTSVLQNPVHTYASSGFYTIIHRVTTLTGCTNESLESNLIHFSECSASGNTGGSGGNGGSSGGSSSGGGVPDSVSGSQTFLLTPLSACIPLNVHFHNILIGTTSWFWDFGDGNTSISENPIHVYYTAGNYTVTMIATDSLGVSYTIVYSDYIHASGINTNFSFTQNNDCVNSTLSFNGLSPNAISWLWNFGDGGASTLQNPTHIFSGTLNNFVITLKTSNLQGCSSSMSSNLLNGTDIPVLWANNYFVCSNQTVNFYCSSSTFAAYLWDFGDGTSSIFQNPTHLYLTSGIFNIKLVVTDNYGCIHNYSMQNPITVQDPVADFTFALTSACNSQTVNFTNLSTGVSLPLSSQSKWDFGDGYPVQWVYGENPTHAYTYPGSYQVTLLVNNDSTCFNSITKTVHVYPTVSADFSSMQNTTCLPITVTYNDLSSNAVAWLWDFGDGTTSTLQNPIHTFFSVPTTLVKLTITDNNGCQVVISKPNIAIFKTNFSMPNTNGCAPLNIAFTDLSVNASNWFWDFGDGATSTLQNPTHLYMNNGVFQVSLISQTPDGCIDTMVYNAINVHKPTADFIALNPTSCAPTVATFTDYSIGANSWYWDFGDGSTSVSQSPAHIYNIPGSYTIKLIVSNSNGCSDTLIRVNYIKVPGAIANFSTAASQSCLNSIIQFVDSSINAATWNWNFGDGNSSTQQSPSHTYQYTGQYSISLIVNDSFGCTSNFTLANPITINSFPTSNFTVSDSVICLPASISFYNNSLNATTYLWSFGDGTTSSLQNPSHLYLTSGIATVTLIAANGAGCSDTSMYAPITVSEPPIADFHANLLAGCAPFTVPFFAIPSNNSNVTYSWDFGNGITSSLQNPIITFINPGNYSISLIISNTSGCSDTIIKPAYIQVYDFIPPAESSILFATVLSDTAVSIKWNQSIASDFAYYKLFRKDISTGNYVSIGQINAVSITNFFDINLNTISNSYCYKIQTFDICGNALSLDSLSEHCTMNVTANGVNDHINVTWTPYIGANVTSYGIYRMEIGNATCVLVATVPPTILSLTDTSTYCPIAYSYRIRANDLNGTALSSNSDTSIAKVQYSMIANQQVDIVRSTIIDNSKVLTEWTAPSILPEKITGYAIYRSTDNLNFSLLINVNSFAREYIDADVDVSQQNYYYKIMPENSCNVTALGSNESSSILLIAEISNGNVLLNWTKYEGWDLGVDYYIIEKMDDQGVWNAIKTVDGNQLIYEEK